MYDILVVMPTLEVQLNLLLNLYSKILIVDFHMRASLRASEGRGN